jgi:hypothetical protein
MAAAAVAAAAATDRKRRQTAKVEELSLNPTPTVQRR